MCAAGKERNEECTLAANGHPDGLSHSGEPEEEEVIVIEEPDAPRESGLPVVRVPRTPTQKEIDAHEAIHLPHEDWCEFYMSGRGRNKAHRKKKRFCAAESDEVESEAGGIPSEPLAEDTPLDSPVPRICMDYFYVSGRPKGSHRGAKGMSTKELQKKLAEMGKSNLGQRNVLVKGYEKSASSATHWSMRAWSARRATGPSEARLRRGRGRRDTAVGASAVHLHDRVGWRETRDAPGVSQNGVRLSDTLSTDV